MGWQIASRSVGFGSAAARRSGGALAEADPRLWDELPLSLQEYTCPRCESGFIEEVTDDSRNHVSSTVRLYQCAGTETNLLIVLCYP
uniref:Uncharacterized protein n=1 Tax=Athene cunicularia TaxID=194338 RepID=A0A663N0N7_ATHCN